jgi:hypothetical protein
LRERGAYDCEFGHRGHEWSLRDGSRRFGTTENAHRLNPSDGGRDGSADPIRNPRIVTLAAIATAVGSTLGAIAGHRVDERVWKHEAPPQSIGPRTLEGETPIHAARNVTLILE